MAHFRVETDRGGRFPAAPADLHDLKQHKPNNVRISRHEPRAARVLGRSVRKVHVRKPSSIETGAIKASVQQGGKLFY